MWRWSNPDARPISEYLYDYSLSRRHHRFLYYCRDCVRNFDVTERIGKCPRCGERSIIELPKEAKMHAKVRRTEPNANLLKLRTDAITIVTQLQHMLWRAKIATYYFLLPTPEELK